MFPAIEKIMTLIPLVALELISRLDVIPFECVKLAGPISVRLFLCVHAT